MTEQNIKVIEFEDTTGKSTGKAYTRFRTDKGWMSVFDNGIITALKEAKGKDITLKVKTNSKELNNKEYVNINALVGKVEAVEAVEKVECADYGEEDIIPIEVIGKEDTTPVKKKFIDVNTSIIRQTCVKSACSIANVNADAITEIAERLEKWITR